MIISKKRYDDMLTIISRQQKEINTLKKIVLRLTERSSVSQNDIIAGDIDFPNSTVKGGNADNTGTDVNDIFLI